MKATELLLKQHREIEQLLERLKTAEPENEGALRQELANLLVAHATIEQEHFYPALRDVAPERIDEALEEHGLAGYELARQLSVRPGDEKERARITVLGDVVLAHVRKEESDLFRRAESALTNQELAEIGDTMMRSFEHVRRTGYERILARMLAENMPRLAGRAVERGKAAQRAPAKKKATARRGAAAATKRGTARRAEAGAVGARGTAKRGTAKRGTAKRGTAKRGTAKRGATQRGAATTTSTTKRGAAGARATTKRNATGTREGTKGSRGMARTGARGAKSRAAR